MAMLPPHNVGPFTAARPPIQAPGPLVFEVDDLVRCKTDYFIRLQSGDVVRLHAGSIHRVTAAGPGWVELDKRSLNGIRIATAFLDHVDQHPSKTADVASGIPQAESRNPGVHIPEALPVDCKPANQFAVGDVVRLRSGGPAMTVAGNDGEMADVFYWVNGQYDSDSIDVLMLEYAK